MTTSVWDVSLRFCSGLVVLLSLIACSDGSDGAGTANVTTGVSMEENGISIDVGEITFSDKRTCTVIGSNITSKDGFGFLGLSAYHCFQKGFQCNAEKITWRSGGETTCEGAIDGNGRGQGDFALIKLKAPPPKLTRYEFPKGLGIGNALFLMGPVANRDAANCKVVDILAEPFRVQHNCGAGSSSGLSGAPLFRVEGNAKKLIGIHVNQSGNTLEATLWPVDFLRSYLANGARSAIVGRRADAEYTQCQEGFFKFLQGQGVAGTPYSSGFVRAAKAHLARNKDAFSKYLKTDLVPFHLRISGRCEELAAGEPLGTGLVTKGDQCKRGREDESCDVDCCDGVNFSPLEGSEEGCKLFKENRERASKQVCG